MHLAGTNSRAIVAVFRSVPVKRPLISVKNKFFNKTLNSDYYNDKLMLKKMSKFLPKTTLPMLGSVRSFSTFEKPADFSDKSQETNKKTVCPQVLRLAEELQSRIINTEFFAEIKKQATEQAVEKVKANNSDFNINFFKIETKLDNLLKDFIEKITKHQNTDGYSEMVDRYFKTSVTIEVLKKNTETVIGGMDLVSSNGRGTPIVTLPSRITYANGDKIEFESGLKNNSVAFDRFKSKYITSSNPSWGEGRLFYCNPNHLNDLMTLGKKAIIQKEWSGVFALANKGTPMAKVLELHGFEKAQDGDKNAIDYIEFIGGKIPKLDDDGEHDGDLDIPKYKEKYIENGELKTKEKVYQVYYLKKEKVEEFFGPEVENNTLTLPKDFFNLKYIHA